MNDGVLHGVRVVDFGRYIAGPYCAAVLADLGADVIRVERADGSEDRFLAPVTDDGDGAIFLQCNRGKRAIAFDPLSPDGREITRRLVETADVIVANLPRRTLAEMGLDFPALSRQNPRAILTAITAFGNRGPYAHRVGFDGIGQAMSGAMYLSGTPDAPSKSIANYVDFTTAVSAALGTVAALLERTRTGRGQLVEGSLLGSALTLMNGALAEEALLGIGRVGSQNRSQLSAPSDTFRTRDGWVLVQTVGQPLFERWTRLVGEPAWLQDPRFKSDIERGKHGALLCERMQAWCGERSSAVALAELEAAKIPAGPVLSPHAALLDPQVQGGDFFAALDYPGLARAAPIARLPFELSEGGVRIRGRAPTLGEHTEQILGELGYDAAEIEGLRDKTRDGHTGKPVVPH